MGNSIVCELVTKLFKNDKGLQRKAEYQHHDANCEYNDAEHEKTVITSVITHG